MKILSNAKYADLWHRIHKQEGRLLTYRSRIARGNELTFPGASAEWMAGWREALRFVERNEAPPREWTPKSARQKNVTHRSDREEA